MQQQYQGYPYYAPIYPQTPHMGAGPNTANQGFMPYYPPHNTQFMPSAPTMPPAPAPPLPMARPKQHRGSSTLGRNAFPLKSAMKKKPNPAPEVTLTRQRTNSNGHRINPLGRQRTNSNPNPNPNPNPNLKPEFIPIHLFLSFHGNNEFRVENAVREAVPELRHRILPLWHPGVEIEEQKGYIWRVRFMGSPWNSRGSEAIAAWGIITEMFTLFAKRGYTYQTSMKTGNPPPRLIFEVTDLDNSAHFFLGYFSRSGHRLTLVTPPIEISGSIGRRLKAALPGTIASDRAVDGNLHVIELRQPGFGAPQLEKHHFITHVLKVIDELGYRLEATIPVGRRSPLGLGLGPKRELFVFRGSRFG